MKDNDPKVIAALLNTYEPGYLPEPLFVSIARLAVLTAVEFIPLRKGADNSIEVLLFERPATDPVWPSMLHTPGTMLRPSDKTFEDGFSRLFQEELKINHSVVPVFVGTDLVHHKRGSIVTLEYIVGVDQETVGGKFYHVENLPGTFIDEQKQMVLRAAEKFKSL